MPVVGLPTAAEASLSDLLTTQALTSWKVVGEGDSTVVVLRFHQDGRPPYHQAMPNSLGYFRRKAPCQIKRDEIRSQRRREEKTQATLENLSTCPNPNDDLLSASVSPHGSARENHAPAPTANNQPLARQCSLAAVSVGPPIEFVSDKATKEYTGESEGNENQEVTTEDVGEELLEDFATSCYRASDSLCRGIDFELGSSAVGLASSEMENGGRKPSAPTLSSNSAGPPEDSSSTHLRYKGKERKGKGRGKARSRWLKQAL